MKFQRLFALALILGLSLLGASGIATAQDATPADGQSFPVHIRFLNAMTSLDAVDVYINGDEENQRVAEGLKYGAVSDAYEGTAPVTGVVVKLNVTGGFDRYIYSTIVPTEAGKEYLVVISDLILIPTEFDQSALGVDEARARVVNAAAQSPALDIYASATDAGTPSADVAPVVSDISFSQVTDGGVLPAGSYDISATATGTSTSALDATAVTIDAGQVYTFVIIGTPGDTDKPLTLVPVSVAAD